MKKLFYLYVLIIIATLAGVPSVMAADTYCSGDLGAVTIPGNLIVGESCQCTLNGTVIKKRLIVNNGGRIIAEGVHVSGDLQASDATQIQLLQESWIGGNVSITGTSGSEPSIISDAQIHGNLQLIQNIAEFVIRQNTISGNLRLKENNERVEVCANTISGNLFIIQNTGGITVIENKIKGNLTCKDNDPSPRGSDNTVSGKIKSQCADMEPAVVAVPNIVGLSQADAEAAISGRYLEVGTISTDYSAVIPEGYVISQSPPAGTIVAEDTLVDFVVCVQSGMPVITFSANPQIIIQGQSSQLSWTIDQADSASIDNGIGPVALTGSISVSPGQTTTYTLTATGPGGTATKSVTVTVNPVPVPTVTITADPASIIIGQSATLTWNSTNAGDAVIDQGIGQVSANGSTSVSPVEITTYTISVTGPGGTATDSATVTVIPLSISITSPLDGDTISMPAVMIQGVITNPLGNEVGVNVNGITALVYGNRFVANHIPLKEGENSVTATATDIDGHTVSASISVNASITGNCIGITANPEMGVSPFETALTVDGTFSFTNPTLWGTGPGAVEIVNGTEDNEYNARMTTPGIYIFTAEATDDQGYVHTGTLAIHVISQEELDTLLKAKWNGMKSALAGGNIDEAVKYFSESSQSIYRQQFTALSSVLNQIAGDMGAITFMNTNGNQAIYDLRTVRNGKTYSFQLLFIREEDGIWRIRNF